MSPGRISKIQIAFLGETRGPFLGADPSGKAPRAGLVQDAACGTGAQRRLVLDKTEHGDILVTSEAMRCQFPVSPNDQQRSCCDDQLNPPQTPRVICSLFGLQPAS